MSGETTEVIDEEREERVKKACRQLRSVTPETVWKVVAKPIYWTPEFLSVLFTRVEGLRLLNAENAWMLGEVLPVLVDKIPWADFADADRASWTVRASALAAELADLTERLVRANAFFKQSIEVDGADVLSMAELYRRRAACAVRAGDTSATRIYVGNAINRYRELDASPEKADGLAEALFLDGIVHDEPLSLGEALTWVHPGQTGAGIVFDAASTALADRIGRPMSRDQMEGSFTWLVQTRKRSFRGIFQSTQRFRIVWSEARLLVRLGCGRIARARYKPLWGHFISQDEAASSAVCGLDWAIAALLDEEPAEAADVLRRTVQRLDFIKAADLVDAMAEVQDETDDQVLAELRQRLAAEHLSGPGRWYPLAYPEKKPHPALRRSRFGLTSRPVHE